MKKIIFKNIFITTSILSLTIFLISSFIIYNQTVENAKDIAYAQASLYKEILKNNPDYLNENKIESPYRITLIAHDGKVIFDNQTNVDNLENHITRPEVQDALNNKTGFAIRNSKSTGFKYIYCALALDNGNIIRVSFAFSTFNNNIKTHLIYFLIIAIFILFLSTIVSNFQLNKIIQPINNLDLQNPLNNKTYPELQKLLISLDYQNNLRKEFSANVSHELKTPLTAISGYAEIMANGIAKAEDHQSISKKIHEEALRLLDKINNIIKISKLDEDKIELDFTLINYKQLINEIVNNLQPLIAKHEIKVETELENIEGKAINSIMYDALYNIIQNSIKYNKQKGSIKIRLNLIENNIYIRVKDTGIGIEHEEIPRIFERFYRVDKSRSQIIEGSGLGLAISKHALLLHNAKINVYSKINEGTTFEIIIPKD